MFDPYNWTTLPPWNDLSADCYTCREREEHAPVRACCGDPFMRAIILQHRDAPEAYADALLELRDTVFDLEAFIDEVDAIGAQSTVKNEELKT